MNLKLIDSFFLTKVWFGILFICFAVSSFAQVVEPVDKKKAENEKNTQQNVKTDTLDVKSTSKVNSQVKYTAEDSIRFDRANNVVYLYGKARIIYDTFELDADQIRLDQKNNIVFAKGYLESKSNIYRGRPILKQAGEPPVTTDSLTFDYKTKRGKSYGALSNYNQGYLQAEQFKKNEYGEGFFKNGIYTTCDMPHPHFGIHITRGIVTQKQIVAGPLYMEVADIPLPLGLPFGFFPKQNKRRSGWLVPRYRDDATRGLIIENLGYYISPNEYWGLELRSVLQSKGTFQTHADLDYKKRYKHDARLELSYAENYDPTKVEGTPEDSPEKNFKIVWRHTQDAKANPGTTFSANVTIATRNYDRSTAAGGTYNLDQISQNTLNSSVSYGKDLGLFNFSSSLLHSQDIQKGDISLDLPSFSLNMRTINPFDLKKQGGANQKWYKKITLGYTLQGKNQIKTKDYLLFKRETLGDFQNGLQHDVPVNLSLNVFKYFQLIPNITYNEKWYLQTIRKRNTMVGGVTPTTTIDTISGFQRAYEYKFSTSLSTKLYGKVNFKKGRLVALRHVATPSISFNYKPDFGSDRFGYYRNVENALPDAQGRIERYSIFENAIYGSPSTGKEASMGFGLENILEAKKKTKSNPDSTIRTGTKAFDIIPLIQSLSFRGNYNFAADSFHLSTIGFSGRTALFKRKLEVNIDGTLDPYQINNKGTKIDRFTLQNGQLARLTALGISLDLNLKSDVFKRQNSLNNVSTSQSEEVPSNNFVDFNVPWDLKVSYRLDYRKPGLDAVVTNSLNVRGSLKVTPKWTVTYRADYDFKNKKIASADFSIVRDLHCWNLTFQWIPIGLYKSYSVELRIKSSVLRDLTTFLSKKREFTSFF